jgi:hypothetical protein
MESTPRVEPVTKELPQEQTIFISLLYSGCMFFFIMSVIISEGRGRGKALISCSDVKISLFSV